MLDGRLGDSGMNRDNVMQRTSGQARLALAHTMGRTAVKRLYQEGAAKIRMPQPAPGGAFEAVLINTAGGLTGGDRIGWDIIAELQTGSVVTTQACERLYRTVAGEPARVVTNISVGSGARLDWLPQETILFEGSSLVRTLNTDLAEDATLLAAETVVFGREAMRESLQHASFHDRWRVRRGGRLIFADDLRFEGDIAQQLQRTAIAGGARAITTLGYFAQDADAKCAAMRARFPGIAASAFDGKLIARLAAGESYSLRKVLIPLLGMLCAGGAMPKAWTL